MIIGCPNCSRRFNIDETLIPKNGRILQCGSCNHKWHYEIPIEIIDVKETAKLTNNQNEINISTKELKKKKIVKKIKSEKKKIFKKNKKTNFNNEKNKNIPNEKHISLFNSFLVIIISLIAIVIILDTFKEQISNYIPMIIPMLNNLYIVVLDINLFIKDLIK